MARVPTSAPPVVLHPPLELEPELAARYLQFKCVLLTERAVHYSTE